MRPSGLADKRFQSLYLFTACRPGTDQAFALALPEATTTSMSLFLAAFAQQLAPDAHAVLILDQAGPRPSADGRTAGDGSAACCGASRR